MCGISGIYSKQTIDPELLPRMVEKLRHRGPEAEGFFFSKEGTAALGHNRLRVIDLSSAANQPMVSADNRFVIVFNGEIYNYQDLRIKLRSLSPEIQFRTQSDTETILHAFSQWGFNMVNHLDGMFALAIFDQQLQTLFLCRDRVGKKPLFYYHDDTQFVFASEIKALLVHPAIAARKLNRNAINFFLHVGYIPGPHTIYEGICKFPAGSWVMFDQSHQLKIERYWKIEDEINQERLTDVSLAKQRITQSLEKAVQKRLISDVPVGAFLSGGTDSSLVVAVASKYSSSPLKTFNIGFTNSKFDESNYAFRVARELKTDHHQYMLEEKEAVELLDGALAHFDEPFADTSAIPTMLVSKLAKKEVTVCLTGDGGDELFQGYGSYTWADRLSSWPWQTIRTPLSWVLYHSRINQLMRAGLLLKQSEASIYSHIFSQENYFFSHDELANKLLLSNREIQIEYEPTLNFLSAGEQQALFDFNYYLCDDLLVKVDRASMRYALECRCPLLDRELITVSSSLDVRLKKRSGVSKWILKELLSNYLPKDLVHRPKWGFSVPLSQWLKNDLRYLIDNYTNDSVTEEVGLFNKSYVTSIKENFLNGHDFLYNRLWVIIALHKWWKQNQP